MKFLNADEREESQKTTYRTYLWWFLLISILIHLFIALVFLRYGFQRKINSLLASLSALSSATPATKQEERERIQKIREKRENILASLQALKKDDPSRRAKLRAPKSSFGWVLFDEPKAAQKTDELKQIEIPTTIDGSIGEAQVAQATEDISKKSAAKAEEIQADQIQDKKSAPPQIVAQIEQPAKELLASTIPEDGAPLKQSPISTDNNIQERIDQIIALQQKLDAPQSTGQTARVQAATDGPDSVTITDGQAEGQPGVRVRGAKSTQTKPKRNIIALTKGFIEKWEGEEGTDLIDRDGDPNRRPSIEELKYISYESKITWSLQASWKQNFCYRPWTKNYEGDAVLEFAIDEHGKLISCNLLQSTGYKELDDMIMKNMKCASPFPPLPKHFGVKQYNTGRLIQVRSDRFKF